MPPTHIYLSYAFFHTFHKILQSAAFHAILVTQIPSLFRRTFYEPVHSSQRHPDRSPRRLRCRPAQRRQGRRRIPLAGQRQILGAAGRQPVPLRRPPDRRAVPAGREDLPHDHPRLLHRHGLCRDRTNRVFHPLHPEKQREDPFHVPLPFCLPRMLHSPGKSDPQDLSGGKPGFPGDVLRHRRAPRLQCSPERRGFLCGWIWTPPITGLPAPNLPIL